MTTDNAQPNADVDGSLDPDIFDDALFDVGDVNGQPEQPNEETLP